jgi:hypothetical protein
MSQSVKRKFSEVQLIEVHSSQDINTLWRKKVNSAPCFFPTEEEFADPYLYISKIKAEGEKYGICKIRPPIGWTNHHNWSQRENSSVLYPTRSQRIDLISTGVPFPDGPSFTAREYKAMADNFANLFAKKFNDELRNNQSLTKEDVIEELFWKIASGKGSNGVEVFYANDLETSRYGSGFLKNNDNIHGQTVESSVACKFEDTEYYKKCGWNLNNLPYLPSSVLRALKEEINGVNIPWLYFGMLFTLFAWHNEDHYLLSLNYMHSGEKKTWYGVPGQHSLEFETILANTQGANENIKTKHELLSSITNMMSPEHLVSKNVPVYRLIQEPGDFVITFPQAYHSGFSHGFNMSEACNFAFADWLPFGRSAVERYRQVGSTRSSCFSHEQLVCALAQNYNKESLISTGCEYIANELSHIIDIEEKGRLAAVKDGLQVIVQLTNEFDLRQECFICRSICYLSCIVCRCEMTRNPTRLLSCLHHAKELCECDPRERVLCQWYSMKSLRLLLENLKTREVVNDNDVDIEHEKEKKIFHFI